MLKNFYDEINGDYEKTINRLGSKDFVLEFVKEFKNDPTYSALCSSYESNDIENAFLSAHTLKGICANLGFTKLYDASSCLTEILRKRTFDNSKAAYDKVLEEYKKLLAAYKNIED